MNHIKILNQLNITFSSLITSLHRPLHPMPIKNSQHFISIVASIAIYIEVWSFFYMTYFNSWTLSFIP